MAENQQFLHMVILRHGPETCPAASPAMQEKCGARLAQLGPAAPGHGAELKGWWADVPGHTFFLLIEAPSAHAIQDLVTELELFHWNTMELRPVIAVG